MQASKPQVLASKHTNVQISKLPTQAPAPKASAPSPSVRKTPVPAPSLAMVNSPPSLPLASSKASVSPPSSISTPAEAPGLAQSGTVLDRVGFVVGSGFTVVLDLGSLLNLDSLPDLLDLGLLQDLLGLLTDLFDAVLDLGSLPDLLDLGSRLFWIWVCCRICWVCYRIYSMPFWIWVRCWIC